jgi:hypothetical protein
MAEDKIFAEGFSFKRRDNAPEFVVGRQSIKVDEAVAWLKAHAKNGWVNIDIKQARGGNYYCELDTWESPNTKTNNATPANAKVAKKAEVLVESEDDDDLPF